MAGRAVSFIVLLIILVIFNSKASADTPEPETLTEAPPSEVSLCDLYEKGLYKCPKSSSEFEIYQFDTFNCICQTIYVDPCYVFNMCPSSEVISSDLPPTTTPSPTKGC